MVDAEPDLVWDVLLGTDLIELGRRVPLVGVLGALRILPEIASHLFHGRLPQGAPESMHLREIPDVGVEGGGWIVLGERPGEELAFGLVGKFWRPLIPFADVAAEDFRAFSKPGAAKTVYALAVRPLDGGRTLLTGMMRTATPDEHARRWFRRYWTFGVGSGAHVLVNALLDSVREAAESKARVKAAPAGV